MGKKPQLEDVLNEISGYTRSASTGMKAQIDKYYIDGLDGTKKTYDRLMKQWFLTHGVNAMASEGITSLCDQ